MIGRKVQLWGRVPSPYMIIGEGPGKTESETGVPFSGASGAELDYVYLKRAARMSREEFAITNVVKWRTDENDRDPTSEEIARDEAELIEDIQIVNPKVIVAVGRIAAQWLMQSPSVDMERYHGTPISCPRYPSKTLIVVYHPAAGLHQPDRYYHQIYWDFEQVGRVCRGEIGPVVDQHPFPDYEKDPLVSDGWLDVALDTEGRPESPWGMSCSDTEGLGRVLRVPVGYWRFIGGTYADEFNDWAEQQRQKFIFHNALYDLPVLRAMSMVFDGRQVHDTMLMAYLLPYLPRGLKALAFKLCGMEMKDYEDVIRDAQERIAKEYLLRVADRKCPACTGEGFVKVPLKKKEGFRKQPQKCAQCGGDGTQWPTPAPSLVYNSDGTAKEYRPRGTGRAVRALLERGTDLKAGWENLPIETRDAPDREFGGIREATLDDIPKEDAIQYSARDSDATLRVYHALEPIIRREGLWNVYEIDRGIIPIVDRMQTNGIKIDIEYFKGLEAEFAKEQQETTDLLASIAGNTINPASPKQVGDLIYNKIGVKGGRFAGSTDEKTLESIKIKYKGNPKVTQVVDLITNYRELDKLLNTYVRTLPSFCDSNGRIHSRFLLHVQASGRISSRDPNLMQQPTRTERGRRIRAGFIPERGRRLASVDLDQIELRVAAHLSQDSSLIGVFHSGQDVHKASASLAFGKPIEEVTTEERRAAKIFNYGVLYGMSAKRLQRELYLEGVDITLDGCIDFINKFFAAYPGLRAFIEETHSIARKQGHVECMFGRRRYVQGVWSVSDKVREESLRWAVSHRVSATAAAIFKLFLTRAWGGTIVSTGALPLVPVHDELVLEVEEGRAEETVRALVGDAASAAELVVPIQAKGKSGMNWSELK